MKVQVKAYYAYEIFRISAFATLMQQIIESRLNNGKRTLYPGYFDGQIYQIGIEEYKD